MNNVKWYIIAGAVLGVLGATLVHFGNPGNMGVCVACFLRDTTGALGFHRQLAVCKIFPRDLRDDRLPCIFGMSVARVFAPRRRRSDRISRISGSDLRRIGRISA